MTIIASTGLSRAARATLRLSALLLALAPLATTADSMRCGSRLITEGDTIDKVLALCGEPSSKSRTWIVRQPRYQLGSNSYPFPGEEEVPVDLWTYDLGPNKLVRRLRFVDGELQSVETLEHGVAQSAATPADAAGSTGRF